MKKLTIEFKDEVSMKDISDAVSEMFFEESYIERIEIENLEEPIIFQREKSEEINIFPIIDTTTLDSHVQDFIEFNKDKLGNKLFPVGAKNGIFTLKKGYGFNHEIHTPKEDKISTYRFFPCRLKEELIKLLPEFQRIIDLKDFEADKKIKQELKRNPNLKVHFFKDCKKRFGGRIIMGDTKKEVNCEECLKRLNGKVSTKKKLSIHKWNPDNGKYLCNPKSNIDKERTTVSWKKVTCKNCLKMKND